ncbi:MAG: hypothetical protein [Olavius algarvensis Gamma 1 endosymbiont]|nr:MAG: hypothetical protein [Olavius algarvensis Gamma 1 endosymbiont]
MKFINIRELSTGTSLLSKRKARLQRGLTFHCILFSYDSFVEESRVVR